METNIITFNSMLFFYMTILFSESKFPVSEPCKYIFILTKLGIEGKSKRPRSF